MVGGEQANDKQALMKRKKVNEDVQRRRKEIAAALGRGAAEDADDDEILVKAYDDVQSTLKARTELAKKMKVRVSGRTTMKAYDVSIVNKGLFYDKKMMERRTLSTY